MPQLDTELRQEADRDLSFDEVADFLLNNADKIKVVGKDNFGAWGYYSLAHLSGDQAIAYVLDCLKKGEVPESEDPEKVMKGFIVMARKGAA